MDGDGIELEIGGMTCASCASRVERGLGKIVGVTATVNLATERARVLSTEPVSLAELIAAVERTGYTAVAFSAAAAAAATRQAEALKPDGDSTGPSGSARPAEPAKSSKPSGSPGSSGSTGPSARLAVSVALAIPVMVLAMVPAARFAGWEWVSLALAAPVASWGAWPFHRAALRNARHGAATMDTLVSVGVTASLAWSACALATGRGHTYLEVAAAVTAVVLLGRFLEARARRRSGDALRALLSLGARDACVLRDGTQTMVPAGRLAAGDAFVVRPGEKIAADGVVISGRAAVDRSMLTGEPVPADAGPGEPVAGGCLVADGRLVIRATRVGADTQLAQMAWLVAQAQNGKAEVQRLADRVSAVFVPVVIGLALATLVGWLAAGRPAAGALTAAVAVLIVACPCAMGLATPTALLAGTGRGAQLGILIRGPEVLESTRAVDTIVLDKTGTVTSGRMSLVDVAGAEDPGLPRPENDGLRGTDEAGPPRREGRGDLLRLAGGLESASGHPVAVAIEKGAAERLGGPLPEAADLASHPGLGVEGTVDGRRVAAGRPGWLESALGFRVPGPLAARAAEAEASGRTAVLAGWGGVARGVFVVSDTLKPTSAAAVARLRGMGLHPVLLTGDNERAAGLVAAAAGIDDVIAGVLPAGKADVVKRLQDEGRVVAMAGDGVNDAAALAQADLGIAMGTGTDAAMEAGDLTLVAGDLLAVPDAIALSRRTLRTIKLNLCWAFGYNAAAIPLAAFGLLNPVIAAAAMAFSSVFVVSNSLRLRRFTPLRG